MQTGNSTTSQNYLLQVTYLMNWTTRYGYDDIFGYPEYFRVYMNTYNGTSTLTALEEKCIMVDGWNFVQGVGLTAFVNEL